MEEKEGTKIQRSGDSGPAVPDRIPSFGRSPIQERASLGISLSEGTKPRNLIAVMRTLLLRSLFDCVWIVCIVCFVLAAHTANALCYTPSGNVSNDLSCSPGTGSGTSICCRAGYSCTTAKLCLKAGHANASGLAFDGTYIRGTCEDRTWQAPECGGNCVKGMSGAKI